MAKRTKGQQVFDTLRGHYQSRDQIARQPLNTLRMALDPFLNGETSLAEFLTSCGLSEDHSSMEQEPVSPDLLGPYAGEVSPLGVRFVLGPESIRRVSGSPGKLGVAFARRQLRLAHIVSERLMFVKVGTPAYGVAIQIGPEIEEIELAIRSAEAVKMPLIVDMNQGQRLTWAKQPQANASVLEEDCPKEPAEFAQRQLELARLVITLGTLLRSDNNRREYLTALHSELSYLRRSISQISESAPNRLTPLLQMEWHGTRALAPRAGTAR
jgi:hypothetical protein